MTQKELARRLRIHHSLVSRIESGERWPSVALWQVIHHFINGPDELSVNDRVRLEMVQARVWRSASPDRKGKRP